MRILQVVPCYLPGRSYGGPIASVHGLARALVASGHEVSVFTTDRDGWAPLVPPPARTMIDGVDVRYFHARFPRRLHTAPSMKAALREEVSGFDLAHLHGLYSWPCMRAAREAETAGIPYVVSPRGMLVRDLIRRRGRLRKELWIRAFDRRTLERSALVHATSEREANDLAAFPFRWPHIATIANGVEPFVVDASRASLPVREAVQRDDAILFLGRISWKKGLDRLVRAVAMLDRGHLLVAGADDGYGAELRRMIHELELGSRVTLLGEVDGPDKALLLDHARVLALTSHHENFGNVVVEAMSAGLPVVVTEAVGAASFVASAGVGRVVAGDPEAIATSLAELLADAALCTALGEQGRRVALESFSWTSIVQRFEEAYAEVVANRTAAAA